MTCNFYTTTDAFDRFLTYTNEKLVLAREISTLYLIGKGSFIDVGAGNGDLTDLIKENFDRTVVVEPSERLFRMLEKKKYDLAIKSTLEDLKLKEKFDFVLCSHVLYYTKDWQKSLEKMYKLTRKKGLLCIISHAGTGEWNSMMKKFAPKIGKADFEVPGPRYLTNFLREKNLSSFHKVVSDTITIPSVDKALALIPFMFRLNQEDVSREPLEELRAYFSARKDRQGRVILHADHAMMWSYKD